MDDAIILDGVLDAETVPADLHGSTARFRLALSPTEERTDEMILPCSIADPVLAAVVLHDLVPGDKLRVTGYLRLPSTPDEGVRLVVTALEVRQPAPLGFPGAAVTATIERHGPYVYYFDAHTDEVSVWTHAGVWVGRADTPDDLADVLDTFEQRQAAGGE